MKHLKAFIGKHNASKATKNPTDIFILVPDNAQDKGILCDEWLELSENIGGSFYDLAYIVREDLLNDVASSLEYPRQNYWFMPITKMKIEDISEVILKSDFDSDDWCKNFQQIDISRFI